MSNGNYSNWPQSPILMSSPFNNPGYELERLSLQRELDAVRQRLDSVSPAIVVHCISLILRSIVTGKQKLMIDQLHFVLKFCVVLKEGGFGEVVALPFTLVNGLRKTISHLEEIGLITISPLSWSKVGTIAETARWLSIDQPKENASGQGQLLAKGRISHQTN